MTQRNDTGEPVLTEAAPYPVELQCEVRLADGTVATVRPIRPADADALQEFHEHLSRETVYRRFFSMHPHLQAREVKRFTQVDYRSRLALVLEVGGRLTAVARYDRQSGTDRAEVAFVVADAMQGHGVGALLLEHLAGAARRRGVVAFVAQTLSTNYPMQQVFRHAGFNCVERWVDGVIEISFPILPTERYLEAVIERDMLSMRARLGQLPLATPSGVGLVAETEVQAHELRAACQSAGLDVAATLVLESLGIDAVEAMLGLGWGPHCAVVALPCAPSIRLGRFVAVARQAARSRPVLTVLAPGHAQDWAEQAGLEVVPGVAHLMDRSAEILSGAPALDWLPPDRGQIVELSDCDIAGARTALDQAGGSSADTDGAPRRLPPALAESVLAAYGIRGDALQARPARSEQNFILEDRPKVGLCAGLERQRTRLLPLTDRDAVELVEAAGVGRAGADAAIEVLLRAARLIDDQPDVARIEIAPRDVRPGETWAGVAMWTGPVRSTDDDPFVRQLARPAPA